MKTSKLGVQFPDSVPDALISALEGAREDRKLVRLFYGDPKTGEDWLEEVNVAGILGYVRYNKIKLLTIRPANGGYASEVMTEHIVKALVEGEIVYTHPKYKTPKLSVISRQEKGKRLIHVETEQGNIPMKSMLLAHRWVAFMKGERGTK